MNIYIDLCEISENSEYFKIKMFDKLYGKKLHESHSYVKLSDFYFNFFVEKLNKHKTHTGPGIFKIVFLIIENDLKYVITSVIKIIEIGFGKMSVHRYLDGPNLKLDDGVVLEYNQYY